MRIVLKGNSASPGKFSGKVKIIKDAADIEKFNEGEILVVPFTSPLYTIAILKASAIVTDRGGIMSHAAIIAREAGIPCITGTEKATQILSDGQEIVVDGDEGIVYEK